MKKFFILFLISLFGLALTSCNGNADEQYNNDDAVMDAPHNLKIEGTVLSWTAIENAKGYNIYVNGVFTDDVKNNSYDFASILNGKNLIFKVQTKSPRGYQDSALSLSIAYMVDGAHELDLMKEFLVDHPTSFPDGYLEELVNKGMTAEEFEDFITLYDGLAISALSLMNASQIYDFINTYLDPSMNVEAIISATVKFLVPPYLNIFISRYESQIKTLERQKDNYDPAEYEIKMLQYQTMLDQMNGYHDMFTTSPDDAILSLTNTVEYLVKINDSITDNMISTVNKLVDSDEASKLSISEVLVVKDEMVNVLKENMPSVQDMVMLLQFYGAMVSLSGNTNTLVDDIENYYPKQANQILKSINLLIDYIDSMDEDFFDKVVAFSTADLTKPLLDAELQILSIKQFAKFKDDNQDDFDKVSEVFTDEEKELIFENSFQNSNDVFNSDNFNPFQNIGIKDMLILYNVFGDSFDILLNQFITTDGEILRIQAIMNSFEYNFDTGNYYNAALATYFTKTGYQNKYDLLQIQNMQQINNFVYPVIMNISDEEYSKLAEYLIKMFIGNLASFNEDLSSSFDFDAAVTNAVAALSATSDDQIEFIQALATYIDDTNLFQKLYQNQIDSNSYYITKYGSNYLEVDPSLIDLSYENYANLILFAQEFNGFMTSANRTMLDNIIDNSFTYFKSSEFLQLSGKTIQEINNAQINLNNLLDYITTKAATYKNYNKDTLTETQKASMDYFQNTIESYLDNITEESSSLPTLN